MAKVLWLGSHDCQEFGFTYHEFGGDSWVMNCKQFGLSQSWPIWPAVLKFIWRTWENTNKSAVCIANGYLQNSIQLSNYTKVKDITATQRNSVRTSCLNLICIINFRVVFYTYSGTESDVAQKMVLRKCECDILWKLQ